MRFISHTPFLPKPCEDRLETDLEERERKRKCMPSIHHAYGNSTFALYIQLHCMPTLLVFSRCLQKNEILDAQEEWQWDFGGNQIYSHPPSCQQVSASKSFAAMSTRILLCETTIRMLEDHEKLIGWDQEMQRDLAALLRSKALMITSFMLFFRAGRENIPSRFL